MSMPMPAPSAATPGFSFVVCGMPRGGTTFFGQLFNAHPDVFCYFMETSLFRQLWMFGRHRPFPRENLPLLEGWLRPQLFGTLVEGTVEARLQTFRRLCKFRDVLGQHGLGEASGPGMRVWDANNFEPFFQKVIGLFRDGLYGPALFEAGMALLGEEMGHATARPYLGEKTPDNVFFLDALHAAQPSLRTFCILREPHSTLESMKRRAMRNDSFFDTAFSTEVLYGISDYHRWMDAAYRHARATTDGSFHPVRFEDLVSDPIPQMAGVYAALGLDMPQVTCDILPQLTLPTEKKHMCDLALGAAEHRLIQLVLGDMLAYFGYPQPEPPPGLADAAPDEHILALGGVHQPADALHGISDAWMSQRADLFLLHAPRRTRLVFDMGCNFPPELGLRKVTLRFLSGEREVLRLDLDAVTPRVEVEIPLAALDRAPAGGHMLGAKLVLECSHAFTPITVPGKGPDLREISFLIRSCRFD